MGSQTILFFCLYCAFTTPNLTRHLKHRDDHRHMNQKKFHCGMNRCEKIFNTERILRMHILRSHALRVSELRNCRLQPSTNNKGQYVCSVGTCMQTFEVYKGFLSHLNFHLSFHTSVKCPYDGCPQLFHNQSSLSSHLTRKHQAEKKIVRSSQVSTSTATCTENEDIPVDDFIVDNDVADIPVNQQQVVQSTSTKDDEALILSNLAQFCMKLEYHHIIPEKVIQYVFEEMSQAYSQSLNFLDKELRRHMKLEDIPDNKIQQILSNVFQVNPFSRINNELRSTHMRKEFYKRTFSFVQPEKVPFIRTVKFADGTERRKETFFYYVPVKETLLACFEDKSLNLKLKPVIVRKDGLLCDVTDGLVFIQNKLFQDHPLCIYIVIYQDGVEIVNPLGPGKKKHKLLAIYLSILNLPEHVRSHISSIKLVALCKENDFVHEVVYGRIVKDLKDLERNGLNVEGIGNIKVGLVFVAGDNLGSHALGGFLENFSRATHFCRYCHVDRPTFSTKHGESVVFDLRTEESYKECVELGKFKKYGHKGIKFDSAFNQLQYSHCCKPGLPCCLGHDLMEGCIAYDLKLFIDYFIAESWFTLHELNEAIATFNYSTEERRDQPLPITEDSQRIKGGAWQIWALLRLFPLLVQEYIYDDKHEVWLALIKLSEITEIVCAPNIHKSHLPYLQAIIDDYLTVRHSFLMSSFDQNITT